MENMEIIGIDNVIPAQLNEDDKIKVNSKRTNAFRKLFDAFKRKVSTKVIPGVKLFVASKLNTLATKITEEKAFEKEQMPKEDINSLPAPTFDIDTNTNENNQNDVQQTEEKAPTTSIFGNFISGLKRNKEEKEEKESTTIPYGPKTDEPTKTLSGRTVTKEEMDAKNSAKKPVKTSIPVNVHIIEHQASDIKKPELKPQEPQKPDTEILSDLNKKYGDLIQFNTWEDYYNSFSAEEKENKTKAGELLTEQEFTNIRLKQAETIKRITEAEEAKRQIEKDKLSDEVENRRARVKENRETIKSLKEDIARREAENVDLNKQNQKAGSSLRTLNNESDKANDKIAEMDEIIAQLTPEKKEEDTKETTFNSKKYIDDMFKEEEAQFKHNKDNQTPKTDSENTVKKPKETEESHKAAPQNDDNSSLISEMDEEFTDQKSAQEPITLNSSNPDYPGTLTAFDGKVTADWKTSPITTGQVHADEINNGKIDTPKINNNLYNYSHLINDYTMPAATAEPEYHKGKTR